MEFNVFGNIPATMPSFVTGISGPKVVYASSLRLFIALFRTTRSPSRKEIEPLGSVRFGGFENGFVRLVGPSGRVTGVWMMLARARRTCATRHQTGLWDDSCGTRSPVGSWPGRRRWVDPRVRFSTSPRTRYLHSAIVATGIPGTYRNGTDTGFLPTVRSVRRPDHISFPFVSGRDAFRALHRSGNDSETTRYG